MTEGYCVKCRKKRKMTGLTKKVMGNKVMIKGACAVCKTKMSTFASK